MKRKTYEDGSFYTKFPGAAVGLEASLCPFVDKNTSQRIAMWSSNVWQVPETFGAAFNRVASGNENEFGKYSFNSSKREKDCRVFESIPKFGGIAGGPTNPKTIVITVDDNNEACYFELDTYKKLYNGFGYKTVRTPESRIARMGPGAFIPKDVVLQTSPSHQNGLYCKGTPLNVIYTTMPHAAEDAIVLAKDKAPDFDHLAIYTSKVVVDRDELPANIYGTQDNPQCIPMVGETVREDGVLMALRKRVASNFTNLTPGALTRVLWADDRIVRAKPGSTVLDVQVYFAPRAFKEAKDLGAMSQLVDLQTKHYQFYAKVVDTYKRLTREGCTISAKLNDLVYRCMAMQQRPTVSSMFNLADDRREAFKNCVIEITHSYPRHTGVGFKYAGSSGDKGVAADLWDPENMPIDEQGIRADMIISTESVPNRTNLGQQVEQCVTRLSTLVHQRLLDGVYGEDDVAIDVIEEFMRDMHAEYAEAVFSRLPTKTKRLDYLDEIKAKGFYWIRRPGDIRMNEDELWACCEKWDYVESPVTFKYDVDGVLKTFTTEQPMAIGAKQVYLLAKIPEHQLIAHEMTHINQHGIPIKPNNAMVEMQHHTKPSPLRIGVDETGVALISLDPMVVAHWMMARAGSREAWERVALHMLQDAKPSAFEGGDFTTKQVIESCVNIKIFYSMMGIVGHDLGARSRGRRRR